MWRVLQIANNLVANNFCLALPGFELFKKMVPAATGWQKRQPVMLVAETGADGNALATLCATAAEHSGSALGLHAGSEAVGLDALAAVGLKCALGHGNALLSLLCGNLCLNGKS
jgi:hypothetical protein